MTIVVFFYLIDCLYTERKDRSILFWKSMPISDTSVVLSKLVVARPVSDRYELRSDGQHPADAARIEAAVKAAHEGLAKWGGVPEPVTIYLVGTHRDLERAVGLSGYDWLRAWTRRDNIIFQAPSTWDASDEALNQLMLHELTHSILFQRSGGATSWLIKNIPLWFREGQGIVVDAHERPEGWGTYDAPARGAD